MRVGIPTEIKSQENRVAITPAGVHHLTQRGHDVLVQAGAGIGSAISDDDFQHAGATIVNEAADVWADTDLLLKVKEPIAAEYGLLRPDQVLFTYLPSRRTSPRPRRCSPRRPPRSPTRPCRPTPARCRCCVR